MSSLQSTLPVAAFRNSIVASVKANPVTIIVAETGAGKSTQIPQYLLEEGYSVLVTQPRRLAARTVALSVADVRNEEFGAIVGFRTAYEKQVSEHTRCLYATDGLALVLKLVGSGNYDVLVLDEVHEWNSNIDMLLAWTHREIKRNHHFKVVIMSATLNAKELSKFFDNAPVFDIPGRLFPVTTQVPGKSELEDVCTLLRQGRNVLWFQPGKTEIAKAIHDVQDTLGEHVVVLPLHGQLEVAEQQKCFDSYALPKCIIATKVAQTSITINDIDAVVDSGLERRIDIVDDVEGLYVRSISNADSAQRKGRAGRTKSGVYIDWCPATDRLDFPVPEIFRSRLERMVLRLAEVGLDMEELTFFHQPEKDSIRQSKKSLVLLGCMDERGTVTDIGHQVAQLPVSAEFGRMIVEAKRLGVVGDVITIAAIFEQGGITAQKIKVGNREYDATPLWRAKFCPTEKESDAMAQLAVFNAASNYSKDTLVAHGVFHKNYLQAVEKRERLAAALLREHVSITSTGSREDILRAVCAGMIQHVWRRDARLYTNGGIVKREVVRESVVGYSHDIEWVVGVPFDLEITTKSGSKVLHLLRAVNKVHPLWLIESAPYLVRRHHGLADAQVTQLYMLAQQKVKPLPLLSVRENVPPLRTHTVGRHPVTHEELLLYGTYELSSMGSEIGVWVRDVGVATTLYNECVERAALKQRREKHQYGHGYDSVPYTTT